MQHEKVLTVHWLSTTNLLIEIVLQRKVMSAANLVSQKRSVNSTSWNQFELQSHWQIIENLVKFGEVMDSDFVCNFEHYSDFRNFDARTPRSVNHTSMFALRL